LVAGFDVLIDDEKKEGKGALVLYDTETQKDMGGGTVLRFLPVSPSNYAADKSLRLRLR